MTKNIEDLEISAQMWVHLHLKSVSRIQTLSKQKGELSKAGGGEDSINKLKGEIVSESHISLFTAYQSVIGIKKILSLRSPQNYEKTSFRKARKEIQALESAVKGCRNIIMHYDEYNSGGGKGRARDSEIKISFISVSTIGASKHRIHEDFLFSMSWKSIKDNKVEDCHSYYGMLLNLSKIVECHNILFPGNRINVENYREHYFTDSQESGKFTFNILNSISLPKMPEN